MKKNRNDGLLLEIIRSNLLGSTNEFKNNNLYLVSEDITTEELGEIIGKSVGEIMTFFWDKGYNVGRNQSLSWDLLSNYCQSIKLGLKRKEGINFNQIIQEYLKKSHSKGQLVARPPVVSIMGHIDHGKTTLLDNICQTQTQKKEAGGITQKVSVFQSEFQGQKIIFLDTPGHSDFIKMRQRGISLTDLVVLMIEARDGIMPQTSEIIDYLHQYDLPTIVFINHKNSAKTDHPANLQKITAQLSEKGLNPLDVINGNAKKVQDEGVNRLLEVIITLSDFRSNRQVPANGVVIDSYLHSQTGSRISELLVQNGELKEKDTVFLKGKFGQAKTILSIRDQKIAATHPGDIAKVTGLNIPAELGDQFLVVNNEEVIAKIEKELTNYWEKKKNLPSPPSSAKKKC